MKKIIKNIYADNISGICFSLSSGLIVITLLLILIQYHSLPPLLPLYNKLAWGYARLGGTIEILIPVLIAMLFGSINTYWGLRLQKRIPLLSRFLFITTFAISFFTALFTIKLLLVII